MFNAIFSYIAGATACTYQCFPGVLLTSTLHNILSNPLAALLGINTASDWLNHFI